MEIEKQSLFWPDSLNIYLFVFRKNFIQNLVKRRFLILKNFFIHFLGNLQEYLNGLYKDARQYDLVAFWKDVCRDFAVKELLLSSQLPTGNGAGYRKSRKSDPTEHSLALSGSERLGALMKRVGEEIGKKTREIDDLFLEN